MDWLFDQPAAQFGSFVGGIAACVTTLIVFFGTIAAIRQLGGSRRTAQADFLLRLTESMQQHNSTHDRLAAGQWSNPTEADINDARRYMGLLELVQVLMDAGMLKLSPIDRILGHRVARLVHNRTINEMILDREKGAWNDFEKLWATLKAKGNTYRKIQRELEEKASDLLTEAKNVPAKADANLNAIFIRCYDTAARRKAQNLAPAAPSLALAQELPS